VLNAERKRTILAHYCQGCVWRGRQEVKFPNSRNLTYINSTHTHTHTVHNQNNRTDEHDCDRNIDNRYKMLSFWYVSLCYKINSLAFATLMNCAETLYLFFKSNRLDKKCVLFIVFCLFVCLCLSAIPFICVFQLVRVYILFVCAFGQ